VRRLPRRLAGFSPQVAKENAALKKFLLDRLYNQPAIVMDVSGRWKPWDNCSSSTSIMWKPCRSSYAEMAQHGARHRVVCDYIAG